MFGPRRIFSLRAISTAEAEPELAKRLRLSPPAQPSTSTAFPTPAQVKPVTDTDRSFFFETPQSSPIKRPTKKEALMKQKEDLEKELKSINETIDEQMERLTNMTNEKLELKAKQVYSDAMIDITTQIQIDVRNELNNIYNPGNELTERLADLIKQNNHNHEIKLDKLTFELSDQIETFESNLTKKEAAIKHEISLHQRTIMTRELEEEKQQMEQVTVEEPKQVSNADSCSSTAATVVVVDEQLEDDCVIINENQLNKELGSILKANNTDSCEVDETTDIDDDDRSFTPCQAQRPN